MGPKVSANLGDEFKSPYSSHDFRSDISAVPQDTSTTDDRIGYFSIGWKYSYCHAPLALTTAPITADLYDLKVIVVHWCRDKDIGRGVGVFYRFVSHGEKTESLTNLHKTTAIEINLMEVRVVDERVEVPTLQPECCEVSPAVSIGCGVIPQWKCTYWSKFIP